MLRLLTYIDRCFVGLHFAKLVELLDTSFRLDEPLYDLDLFDTCSKCVSSYLSEIVSNFTFANIRKQKRLDHRQR